MRNPATHYAAFQKALNLSETQRISGEEMQVCNTFDHRLHSQLRCLAFCAVHFYRPHTEWVGCIQLEVLHTWLMKVFWATQYWSAWPRSPLIYIGPRRRVYKLELCWAMWRTTGEIILSREAPAWNEWQEQVPTFLQIATQIWQAWSLKDLIDAIWWVPCTTNLLLPEFQSRSLSSSALCVTFSPCFFGCYAVTGWVTVLRFYLTSWKTYEKFYRARRICQNGSRASACSLTLHMKLSEHWCLLLPGIKLKYWITKRDWSAYTWGTRNRF